jgi:predicted RNase H-like HicB family nuclease
MYQKEIGVHSSLDLPGLGVGGSTKEEVEKLIQEGIVFHIEGLNEAGLPVPPPQQS